MAIPLYKYAIPLGAITNAPFIFPGRVSQPPMQKRFSLSLYCFMTPSLSKSVVCNVLAYSFYA